MLHTFLKFLEEPVKPLHSQRIVSPKIRQEYYEFDTVRLSTYAQVAFSLLDIYAVDKVLADANTTFHDMHVVRTDTPRTFAVSLVKSAHRFGAIYTKA